MRFLFVSQYFHPESFRVNDLALSLKERGHEVVILTGQPNYPSGQFFEGYGYFKCWSESWKGLAIVRVPVFPRGRGGGVRLALNYLSFVFFATLVGLPRLKGHFDATFVFATSPITSCLPAIFYKFWKHTPVSLWVQDLWPESVSATGFVKSKRLVAGIGRLVRWIYSHCNHILIQSQAFRPSVFQWGAQPEQVHYVPNWAEDFYNKSNQLEPLHWPKGLNDQFVILFAGNLGRAQSLPTIVDAAKSLRSTHPNVHWVFIGTGSLEAWLRDQIASHDLSDQVHLLPRRPPEEMPSYFAKANVLLVTLKKDPIFSLVIPSKVQSYLASGRPLLGSLDGEGARVIGDSQAGLSGEAESVEALIQNIKTLLMHSDSDLRAMGHRGKQYYRQNFHKESIVDEIEQILGSPPKKDLRAS